MKNRLFFLYFFFIFSCNQSIQKDEHKEATKPKEFIIKPNTYLYGINIDSFNVIKKK